MRCIIHLETNLLRLRFSQHGSLYFSDDVSEELRSRPLHQEGDTSAGDLGPQLELKYKIGPTVNRQWWRGHDGRIDANRGPWPDMQTMIRRAADFQLRAIDIGAVDVSSSRLKSTPADIPLLRRMLNMCIRIAPAIVPADPALTAPALNHPDLSLTNLIVPNEGPVEIRHSIDWQGATVSPFCMQVHLPPAMAYTAGVIPLPPDGSEPSLPPDLDLRTPEEQEHLRRHHRYARRQYWYSFIIQGIQRMRGYLSVSRNARFECILRRCSILPAHLPVV